MEKMIEAIIARCEEVATMFYQNKVTEGFGILCMLIEDIQVLMKDVSEKEELLEKNAENLMRLNEVLADALNAMQENDKVLLADIVKYDVIEQLKQIEV